DSAFKKGVLQWAGACRPMGNTASSKGWRSRTFPERTRQASGAGPTRQHGHDDTIRGDDHRATQISRRTSAFRNPTVYSAATAPPAGVIEGYANKGGSTWR